MVVGPGVISNSRTFGRSFGISQMFFFPGIESSAGYPQYNETVLINYDAHENSIQTIENIPITNLDARLNSENLKLHVALSLRKNYISQMENRNLI